MARPLALWLICGLFSVSCASAGKLEGTTYKGPETSYRIGLVSERWTRVTVDEENDLAWFNQTDDAIMQVDSKCNPAFDIPLKALTMHLLIGFTDKNVASQDILEMDGREAMRTHLEAKLDGVPRELLLQVLKKNGCVYDFALVAPPGPRFDAALSDFELLIDGFATVGNGS